MNRLKNRRPRGAALVDILAAAAVATAILAILFVAPTEATMGLAQRIVYVHVAMAWLGLAGFLVMATTAAIYLARRDLAWDQWSQSAAELGWLASSLTLATGSLWAHAAWNTWWTWDPRLMTSFILWAVYCGYLLVRGSLEEPHLRARLAAVLAITGVLDVPLVIMATRWFRGIHPVAPKMDPAMHGVLLLSVAGFTAFFALLLVRRRAQLRLDGLLADIDAGGVWTAECGADETHPTPHTLPFTLHLEE
jgi:heme exporter protein C